MKCWAGWLTSWNQDCWEKYQQPRICKWYHFNGRLKSLMKVKEESEKAGLKLNIQKTKVTASSPNTSSQIEGGKVETVSDFIFLGSKITADGYCSYESKAMTNLDNVLKKRDITLTTKVHIIKTMVFSNSQVWMWELDHKEGWVLKNWCFWTVMPEKTLESLLDSRDQTS